LEDGMKKILLTMAAIGLLTGAVAANAGPEEERLKLVNYFAQKNPDVKLENYVYGALAFDPDSKSQYDAIMEFPPFTAQLEKGEKLFKTPFKNGKTYADCLPNGGKMIAGNYPMFDEAKGRVVTLEDVANDCRVANGEAAAARGDKDFELAMAYLRTLSDGMKMNIKVESPGALKAFEDGKKTYYQRVGQLNFSCASCHVEAAGNRLRSEILSPVLGQAVHWPVFRGGENLVSLQNRYDGCFNNVRHVPEKAGTPRMNNLEYFHSYLSNGLEMKAAVFRK
jgi:sulfur-oxidizing protein SoxA